MKKETRLVADIASAALVVLALVVLIVWTLPGYLEHNENQPEPTPINTGVTKVTDSERGIYNLPCVFTTEGC